MDLNYLQTQIQDELEGAQDYSAKAEECPDYAETFKGMAKQELGHAKNLIEMVNKLAEDAHELGNSAKSQFSAIEEKL